nr:MAG: DNA repair exonuclease [Pseudomonadota bacterium]
MPAAAAIRGAARGAGGGGAARAGGTPVSGPFSLRIAHLSDTHFGTEVAPVRDALLEELRADAPDLLVVTGDITQRARRAQFARARSFLEALGPVPRVCLPGNHDLPLFDLFTRFTRPYARFRRYISPGLEPEYVDDRVALLCVDATSPYRHKDGALPPPKVALFASRLARLTQPFRILATHQPLASATEADRRNVAHGAHLALERWIGAGADLFLGGHIHLPYCLPVRAQEGQRAAVLLQAGTAVSRRTRRGVPNSYNVIHLGQESGWRRMRIERRDFDAGARRFLPRHRHLAMAPLREEGRGGDGAGWNVVAEEHA